MPKYNITVPNPLPFNPPPGLTEEEFERAYAEYPRKVNITYVADTYGIGYAGDLTLLKVTLGVARPLFPLPGGSWLEVSEDGAFEGVELAEPPVDTEPRF